MICNVVFGGIVKLLFYYSYLIIIKLKISISNPLKFNLSANYSMALQTGRNYVKFDFNNIKLAHTWDDSIQSLKSLFLDFIHLENHHIYNKDYKESFFRQRINL